MALLQNAFAKFQACLLACIALALLLLPNAATFAEAANMTLAVRNDKRRVIDFGVFGYGGLNDGVMEVRIRDFLIHDLDEYDSVDEKIGFALDLVPSPSYARRERKTAIKRTKEGDKKEEKRLKEERKKAAKDGNVVGDEDAAEPFENVCFVDDPSFTPETRYLLPLQESLARIGRRVEKNAPATMKKMEKATALRNLARNLTATISIKVDRPGYYALFFYNCKKANRNKSPVPVTFRVHISQYNIVGPEGNQYNSFLPIGETRVPEIYQFTFVVFAALTTVWHIVLFGGGIIFGDGGDEGGDAQSGATAGSAGGATRGRKGRTSRSSAVVTIDASSAAEAAAPPPPPKLIHKLMYFLLILKCLSLFFETVMLKRRRATGKMSAYVDFIFYGLQAVKGFFLFTTILLLGSGWSLLKPFLSQRDRKLLLLLLPLQLIINVAIAVIDSTSEGSVYWSWWRDTLRIADVCCCIAVLMPVITSIYSLRATSDRIEQRRLGRMRQFRTFYLVVVCYMFITRVALDYVASAAPYHLTWAPAVIGELGALFLYVMTGYMFRPAAQVEWDRDEQVLRDYAHELETAEEIDVGGDDAPSAPPKKKKSSTRAVAIVDEEEDAARHDEEGDRLVPSGKPKKSSAVSASAARSGGSRGLAPKGMRMTKR